MLWLPSTKTLVEVLPTPWTIGIGIGNGIGIGIGIGKFQIPGQLAEQGLRRGKSGCLMTGQEPRQKSDGSCLDEDFV